MTYTLETQTHSNEMPNAIRKIRGMRILAVGPLPPPLNGMTVMTAHVVNALRARGAFSHLDTSDHREVGNVGRLDLRNVWLAFRHAWLMGRQIARVRPRLVYMPIAQGTLGILRDALLFGVARAYRIPTMIHFHGAEFGSFVVASSSPIRRLARWCLSDCKSAIVLGRSLRNGIETLLPRADINVVPNGIPKIPRYVAKHRDDRTPRVLFVSNLSPRKGYRDVIRAASAVLRSNREVEFLIAGSWSNKRERDVGERMLSEVSRPGRIRILGEVSGLRKTELFLSSDVFVFPPRRPEGQGLVLLEAMSAGLPVVATDVGPMRETVLGGITGILVPAEDPDALAEAILRLLDDKSLREEMGARGLDRYTRLFTEERFSFSFNEAIGSCLRRLESTDIAAGA